MNVDSPIAAIVCLLAAIAMAALLAKYFHIAEERNHHSPIDGLRGFLAFFVFLHHSRIWFGYLHSGEWSKPDSNLYTHLGHSSVQMFFMITAFLFFNKVLSSREKGIDWGRLYVSRFLRLVPLYLFAMGLLFLMVAIATHFHLNEPPFKVAKEALEWVAFTIFGAPNIDGLKDTRVILAGVIWSLPYEWFFYFSLPCIALVVGRLPPMAYVFVGVAGVTAAALWEPKAQFVLAFAGGIAAALIGRSPWFFRAAKTKAASVVTMACIVATVVFFPNAYSVGPLLLLTLAFALIASGNTLFGALTTAASRMLGEMAYSVYLLHGATIYITFHYVTGLDAASQFSPIEHWLTMLLIVPVLISVGLLSFRLIELPAISRTNALTDWLRARRLPGTRATNSKSVC